MHAHIVSDSGEGISEDHYTSLIDLTPTYVSWNIYATWHEGPRLYKLFQFAYLLFYL